eukprot:2683601-Pyramimonas_sp.AAC.1
MPISRTPPQRAHRGAGNSGGDALTPGGSESRKHKKSAHRSPTFKRERGGVARPLPPWHIFKTAATMMQNRK